MGEAFITRRGAKEQKITFNNTPMVAIKTIQNALSVARIYMAVASDDKYIAFLCGMNASGTPVNNLDIFSRSGQHYVAHWPDALMDMSAEIVNNWLIGICGRSDATTGTKTVKKWHMYNAIRDYGTPITMTNITNYDPLYATCATRFDDCVAVFGGLIGNSGVYDCVWKYSCWNKQGSNAGYTHLFNVPTSRGFATMGKVTSTALLLCGGVNTSTSSMYNDVDVVSKNADGSITLGRTTSLAVAQYKATQANIHTNGKTYLLVGLGLTLPQIQGGLFAPETIVPNINVYVSASDGNTQIGTSEVESFTLPIQGYPVSAVALSFGDCVLYVVDYGDGVTKSKGYLVQLEPLRITTMEFNFSRMYTQGAVIGNDIGVLAGGFKNGVASTDVEVIQIMRNVPIYPGMKYKLGSMASEETSNILTLHPLNDEIKLSGYMKL